MWWQKYTCKGIKFFSCVLLSIFFVTLLAPLSAKAQELLPEDTHPVNQWGLNEGWVNTPPDLPIVHLEPSILDNLENSVSIQAQEVIQQHFHDLQRIEENYLNIQLHRNQQFTRLQRQLQADDLLIKLDDINPTMESPGGFRGFFRAFTYELGSIGVEENLNQIFRNRTIGKLGRFSVGFLLDSYHQSTDQYTRFRNGQEWMTVEDRVAWDKRIHCTAVGMAFSCANPLLGVGAAYLTGHLHDFTHQLPHANLSTNSVLQRSLEDSWTPFVNTFNHISDISNNHVNPFISSQIQQYTANNLSSFSESYMNSWNIQQQMAQPSPEQLAPNNQLLHPFPPYP